MQAQVFKPEEQRVLSMVLGNAAVDCSRIFSRWVKSGVSVSHDRLEVVPFDQVTKVAAPLDEVSVGLYLRLSDGIGGSLLFLLTENSAFELVDMLLRKPSGTTKALGRLENSALNETANILACAYLNGLSANLKIARLIPSPPVLMHDLTESILGSVLAEQAMVQNEALLVHVDFMHAQKKLEWKFFFFPHFQELKSVL